MTDYKQNAVTYEGRLFGPELRFTPSGTAVCEGRMKVSRKDKRTDEWANAWFTVTAWQETAEQMAELGDRAEVIVTGRLDVDPGYTTRAGVEVPDRVKITADRVERVGPSVQRAASEPQRVTEDLADIPF